MGRGFCESECKLAGVEFGTDRSLCHLFFLLALQGGIELNAGGIGLWVREI